MYGRDRRFVGAWPTNDGLLMTYVACPHDEFHAFRADFEGNLLQTLDMAGDLGGRVCAGKRAERFFGTADLANWFRKPFGPGWALVGDAGLGGRRGLDEALAAYEQGRNDAALPMYEFTMKLASFAPPAREEELLFKALAAQHSGFVTAIGHCLLVELATTPVLLLLIGILPGVPRKNARPQPCPSS